jgi:phosphoglucomutase
MDYGVVYDIWRSSDCVDEATRAELAEIEEDVAEIEERFGRELGFGTGGMRGKMGAGTSRMNRYTVRRVTQAYASYLLEQVEGSTQSGVVIAYDSRRMSEEFAREAAYVLAANGIRAMVFQGIRPTPLLSFAVRETGAAGGIVITASHNPPEYNGYKVYGPDGVQLLPEAAGQIANRVSGIDDYLCFSAKPAVPVETVGNELDERYIARVTGLLEELSGEIVPRGDRERLELVYTPLHGTGYLHVPRVMADLGFSRLHVVDEQSVPDGDFPTVGLPNPEDPSAFELSIELAMSMDAQARPAAVIATDPDCDRVGVAAWDGEGYRILTGNQVGVLLADFLIESARRRGIDLEQCAIVKTIVTTEMIRAQAAREGVQVIDTLTGFKYIGARIDELESDGRHFLLGLEESCGYLAGTFVRDKDGVMASALVACVAAWHLAHGRTLIDRLKELYRTYGCYYERLVSVPIASDGGGVEALDALRQEMPDYVAGFPVVEIRDYFIGWRKKRGVGVMVPIDLPRENCIQLLLARGGRLTLRPSGTEPKLKLYIAVRGASLDKAEARADAIEATARRILPVLQDED